MLRCEKRHFLRHLYIKTNILPRQARDKHRESTQKRVAFCAGSVEFDLTDSNGEPAGGRVAKIFGGCSEMMTGMNKFRIAFPAGATPEQKKALLGCTMFIDYNYFEREKNQNSQ